MIDGGWNFNLQENGEEPERLAGERPDRGVSVCSPRWACGVSVDRLVTMSCVIENEYKSQD